MTAIQYGVQYEGDRCGTYVAAMLNRTAAESVVRRDVGEWTPAPAPVPNEGLSG